MKQQQRSLGMVANLTDYIKCYDNVVDEKFCRQIIRTFDGDIAGMGG